MLLSLGLASCGGASESNLLQPGKGGKDSGTSSDGGTADVTTMHDVAVPEIGPMDVGHVMDTTPPPVDTGPPDMGPPKPPPIMCGGTPCEVPANECCVVPFGGGATCQAAADYKTCYADGNTPIFCSSPADCPGQICCGTKNGAQSYADVACEPTCDSTNNSKITFCDPSASPDICAALSLACGKSSILVGFYVCN